MERNYDEIISDMLIQLDIHNRELTKHSKELTRVSREQTRIRKELAEQLAEQRIENTRIHDHWLNNSFIRAHCSTELSKEQTQGVIRIPEISIRNLSEAINQEIRRALIIDFAYHLNKFT